MIIMMKTPHCCYLLKTSLHKPAQLLSYTCLKRDCVHITGKQTQDLSLDSYRSDHHYYDIESNPLMVLYNWGDS